VQPWDKKGFKFPGGAGASRPATAQTFMVGAALVAQKTMHNYPAPIAILSCVYEGSIVPIDKGLDIESQYFVELLTGPVVAQHDPHPVRRQGRRGQARAPAEGRRESARAETRGARRRHDGRGHRLRVGPSRVWTSCCSTPIRRMRRKAKGYSKSLLEKRVSRGKMAAGRRPRRVLAPHPADDETTPSSPDASW
jgi:3-hydroxyacyl-CoA dehydrogenase / enoyl-CoA hydratase / 3-hydroxybutyryl-CoA epimerase